MSVFNRFKLAGAVAVVFVGGAVEERAQRIAIPSVELRQASVADALKYVAWCAGLEVTADETAIQFRMKRK